MLASSMMRDTNVVRSFHVFLAASAVLMLAFVRVHAYSGGMDVEKYTRRAFWALAQNRLNAAVANGDQETSRRTVTVRGDYGGGKLIVGDRTFTGEERTSTISYACDELTGRMGYIAMHEILADPDLPEDKQVREFSAIPGGFGPTEISPLRVLAVLHQAAVTH